LGYLWSLISIRTRNYNYPNDIIKMTKLPRGMLINCHWSKL